MPDSYLLALGATQIDVGPFTRADPGPDFGTSDLLAAAYVEGPHTEGVLAHEQTKVRRMVFPLILRGSQSVANLGLEDQESLLRYLARPGATLDLQPQGATTAVRFDVLSGRYEPDYQIHQNRQRGRLGRLELETLPFGYWPTMITLASVASVALPGAITWSGSIIGDAPALAKIAVQPTVATNIPAGSWPLDFLALSVTHRASHLGFLQAASVFRLGGASLLGVALAPASQAVRYAASQQLAGWARIGHYLLASALEPAYRGRYRAYSWFRVSPSQALPWFASLDVVAEQMASQAALASYQPVATLVPQVASGGPGAFGPQPSPAFQLVDLGDITIPAVGSGVGGGEMLRMWVSPAAADVGVASPVIETAGIYLLPLDSDFAGVLPRGLAQPSLSSPSPARLTLDAEAGQALLGGYNFDLATTAGWANAWQHYRGQLPKLASGVRLDLVAGVRKTGITANTPSYPQIIGSLGPIGYYRMEETSGPTLVDAMAARHGSWISTPSLGWPGKIGNAARFDGAANRGAVASLLVAAATSWSIMAWVRRYGANTYEHLFHQGPLGVVGANADMLYWNDNTLRFQFSDSDMLSTAAKYSSETEPHLLTFTWNYATRGRAIWHDRVLVASDQAAGTYVGSGPWQIGARNDAAQFFNGVLDEVTFFRGTAVGTDIIDIALAYADPVAAASAPPPIVHSGPAFASVSITYRPRFQFLKGL